MIFSNKERLEEKINYFSKFGDTGNGGITRIALSKEDVQARDEFIKRCKVLGAEIKIDDLANIYATIKGREELPGIVVASHLDSVKNGGNYDGVLGVLTGLEAMETIVKENIKLKHPLTVMVWTNEEGACHSPAMIVSGIVCGQFDDSKVEETIGTDGTKFSEAIEASGYKGDRENRLLAKDYKAMLELHIEQGPVLESEKKDIGVVEGVVGMVNYRIKTYGQSDHAGTTPMKFRQDALLAASSTIKYLHEELDKLDAELVYTTGEIYCHPCIHTVIPDYVDFSIDARHRDPNVIKQVVKVIENMPKEFDKCKVDYERKWARNTVEFDTGLVNIIKNTVNSLEYSNRAMYSGAGHDAQYVAEIMPTAMIFVPSKDGHSHCELEYTSMEQCWKGTNVLLNAILEIDKKI